MPQLTEVKIRALKPSGKIERHYDEKGLYLEISKAGGKHWRWKYHFDGKEKRLTLGAWPEVSLKEAREKRDDSRRTLKNGQDPALGRKKESTAGETIFKDVAESWRMNMGNVWAESHAITVKGRLELDVYPAIGDRPITQIGARDVLAIVRSIEERQAFDSAKRVLGVCSMIFRYGVAIGVVNSDPCRDLRGALVPHQKGQFAALTKPKEVGALMRAIDGYSGTAVVKMAMLFSALTFCRPGEIRHAEWGEFDWEAAEWTIPAARMKGKKEHLVPLAHQAIKVVQTLKPLTGSGRYVFPSPRTKDRPMSESADSQPIWLPEKTQIFCIHNVHL